jgi:hypothetical protein
VTRLPTWLHEPFAAAMSQSLLLPAFFALFGVVAAVFLLGFGNSDLPEKQDDLDEADRNAGYAVDYGGDETFVDDDEYLEYEVSWDDEPEPVTTAEPVVPADDSVTEPMRSRAEHLLHAPAETWHSDSVESWRSLLDDEPESEPPAPNSPSEPPTEARRGILDDLLSDIPPLKPKAEPIGFAHNGFHVDEEERFQPLPPPIPDKTRQSRHERSARHHLSESQPERRPFWFESSGRHSRDDDPDDASSYGRHSMPGRD